MKYIEASARLELAEDIKRKAMQTLDRVFHLLAGLNIYKPPLSEVWEAAGEYTKILKYEQNTVPPTEKYIQEVNKILKELNEQQRI